MPAPVKRQMTMNSRSARRFLSTRSRKKAEEEEKKTLHDKFKHYLRRGKAMFNVLKAAAWRREAFAKMESLVQQEKKTSLASILPWETSKSKRHFVPAKKSVIPRFRTARGDGASAKPVDATENQAYVVTKEVRPQKSSWAFWRRRKPEAEAPATDDAPTESAPPRDDGASLFDAAVACDELGVEETKGDDGDDDEDHSAETSNDVAHHREQHHPLTTTTTRSLETTRFRSHPTRSQEPLGELRLELSKKRIEATGSCLVSSRGMAYDDRLQGWRFLVPGLSVLRVEVTLLGPPEDVVLTVREFASDLSQPTFADVTLNHTSLGRSPPLSSEPKDAVFPVDLTTGRPGATPGTTKHVVDLSLPADAAPWFYHVVGLSIASPPSTRTIPSADDIRNTITALRSSSSPGEIAADDNPVHAQRRHDELLTSYQVGYRLRQTT